MAASNHRYAPHPTCFIHPSGVSRTRTPFPLVILSHTVLHARTCPRTSHHLCSSDPHYNCKVCEWKPVLKIPSGHTAILSGLVVAATGTYNKCCQEEPVDTPSGERRSSYNMVRPSLLTFSYRSATASSNHDGCFTQDFVFALSVNNPTRYLCNAHEARRRDLAHPSSCAS